MTQRTKQMFVDRMLRDAILRCELPRGQRLVTDVIARLVAAHGSSSTVALGRVAPVTQRLDVADIVASPGAHRHDVVFRPNVLVPAIRPRWDISPQCSAAGAAIVQRKLGEPLTTRMMSAVCPLALRIGSSSLPVTWQTIPVYESGPARKVAKFRAKATLTRPYFWPQVKPDSPL